LRRDWFDRPNIEVTINSVRLIWPLIPKHSDSALLISPSEFDATINFEDLSQKIAGTAFAPSETVSQFRITIELTTSWNPLVE
jgi:hypothetical protein